MDFAKVLNDLRREKADKLAQAEQLLAENKVAEAAALDGELPPINNGQPDFSGGWSNQSPSGRIIGTYPQKN